MILKKMTLQNYKGFYGLQTLEFNMHGLTVISGVGGSGKTTLIKAINWLFNREDQDSKESISWRLLTSMSSNERSIVSVSIIFEQNGEKEANRTLFFEKTKENTVNILFDEYKLVDIETLEELDFGEYSKTYLSDFIKSLSIAKDWNHDYPYLLKYQLDTLPGKRRIVQINDFLEDLNNLISNIYQREKHKDIEPLRGLDGKSKLIYYKNDHSLEEIISTIVQDPKEVLNITITDEVSLLSSEISLSKMAIELESILKSDSIHNSNLQEEQYESASTSLVRKLVRYIHCCKVQADNDIIEVIVKLTKTVFSASLHDLQRLRLKLLNSSLYQIYLLDANRNEVETGKTIQEDMSQYIDNSLVLLYESDETCAVKFFQMLLYQEYLRYLCSYCKVLIKHNREKKQEKLQTSFNVYAKKIFNKDINLKILENALYGKMDFLFYISKTNYYLPTQKELQLVYFILRTVMLDSTVPIISDSWLELPFTDEVNLYKQISTLKKQMIVTSSMPLSIFINSKTALPPELTFYSLKKNREINTASDIFFEIIKPNGEQNKG